MPKLSPNAHATLVEERRAQILRAAAKVFAAKGYERATIADIAKEARVAEGSIYNYFKNKGDLLVGLPRQVIQPRIESLSLAATAQSGSPEEMLTLMARTMVRAIRENAHIFRILLTALPSMTKKTRQQYLDQVVLYATGMLRAFFEEQIRQGVFRPGLSADILALGFVGMFFPTVLLQSVVQVDLAEPMDEDQVITTCVRVFMNGAMAVPPPPQSRGLVAVE
jgi:TetR/AcrR family transcriptional regulator, fatty acid metabolism regulator protein